MGLVRYKFTSAHGDGIADDTDALQRDLYEAEKSASAVILEDGGVYKISGPLKVPSGVTIGTRHEPRGYLPTDSHVKIVASSPMTHMIDISGTRSCVINGVFLDGKTMADVGVFSSNSVQAWITNSGLFQFNEAGIRGGGCLLMYVDRNYFGGNTSQYAIDLLEEYKLGTNHYYGVNVGTFDRNSCNARKGIRFTGTFNVTNNDFEGFGLEGEATIDVNGSSSSYVNIAGNYLELGLSGAIQERPTAIRLKEAMGRVVRNSIYGPNHPNSIAVDASKNYYPLEVSANKISRWKDGIAVNKAGSAHVLVSSNDIRNVENKVVFGLSDPVTTEEALQSLQKIPSSLIQTDGGWDISGGVAPNVVRFANVDGLNLRHGNFFYNYYNRESNPSRLIRILGARHGAEFTVSAKYDGLTIGHGADFVLKGAADYTLTPNEMMRFTVGDDLKAYQVN